MLCLPDMWLMWDVGSFADVGSASLAMLRLMSPPPEVLVLGCGAEMRPLPAQLQDELVSRGIAVEALDTVHWWLRWGGRCLHAWGPGAC